MKKVKILSFILIAFCLLCVSACKTPRLEAPKPPQTVTYTVTFKQAGQEDKVYTVNQGKDFDQEMPTPVAVDGYIVTWDKTLNDLKNVTSDIVVNAVLTPNLDVEPETPTPPENPTTPDNPGEPSNPDGPGEPSNPDNPGEPTNPSEPSEPTEPTDPTNDKNWGGGYW